MSVPTDRRYRESHEYAKPEGDVYIVGITQHAADELTDITFVDCPDVGDTFAAGEEFGEVESVKATSPLYAPVGGEVVEVNAALADDPSLVNNDPHDGGWMIKIRASEAADYDNLLTPEDYEKTLS